MKVSFIQIDLVLGSRILVELLKQKGYDVKALQINIRYCDELSEDDLNLIYEYVKGSDVVGFSFNSFYTLIAKRIALYLKEKGIPCIISGGNHVTALPEEGLAFSDVIIKYEAEITLFKVLDAVKNKIDLSKIRGIAFKKDGVTVDNGAPEVINDLDGLPFPSLDTKIIKFFDLEKKIYTPEKHELFPHKKNTYFIFASRGCPYGCTYCSNSLYHSLDRSFRKVRKRSISGIIKEMEYAVKEGFDSFYVVDDNFYAFTISELQDFNRKYKERINKPFSIAGLNPNDFKRPDAEEKFQILIDSGLSDIRIGIQSGSNKTLKIFKRGYRAQDLPELLKIVEHNRSTIWDAPYNQLHVALDFICDSVWETSEDKIETIRVAQSLLSQYSIFFYTLVYLPGTEIYKMACENGWIDDKEADIYLKGIAGVEDNIFNRVLFLIAVTKERGITIQNEVIDHLIKLNESDKELSYRIIDTFIDSINGVERHHKVDTRHAALHPYLTGFNKWVKQTGNVGKEVLFRSYHKPYG